MRPTPSAPSVSITALLTSPEVFPLLLPPLPHVCIHDYAHAFVLDDHSEQPSAGTRHKHPQLHLLPPEGICACAYDSQRTGNGRLIASAPRTHGPSSGGPRAFHMSEERTLLRIVAPVRMLQLETHYSHLPLSLAYASELFSEPLNLGKSITLLYWRAKFHVQNTL